MSAEEILSIIKTSFDKVNFAIKQKADTFLDEYDTTLTLAVFITGRLYFGHAGDSGIIALRSDGFFEEVTKPQLGSGYGKERPVYPLAAESQWVFGNYKHRTKAIFLMTDGVLNKTIPPLLEKQEYKLDNAYLFYLYDNLVKNSDLKSWINIELTHILPSEINYDDKTLVAVICNSVELNPQSKKYYNYPNDKLWHDLLMRHKQALYGYKTGFPPSQNVPDDKSNYSSRSYNPVPKKTKSKYMRLRHLLITFAIGFILGVIVTLVFLHPTKPKEEFGPVDSVPTTSTESEATPPISEPSSSNKPATPSSLPEQSSSLDESQSTIPSNNPKTGKLRNKSEAESIE